MLGRGLPGFLREGFLPLAAFYAGLRVSGLPLAMVLAAAASVGIYVHERASGRDGLLVRLSLLFIAVQSAIGLATHSAAAYLAAPVLVNVAWGLLFLGSVAIRRPLAGALACAWYPFSAEFRASDEFRRVYGVESIVWGVYLLGRSAIRLAVLGSGNLAVYVLVVLGTGTPLMLGLVAWSIWYALRRLSGDAGERRAYLGSASSL